MYKVIETLTTTQGEIVGTCERFANDITEAAKIITDIHDHARALGLTPNRYSVELNEVA